MTERDETPPPLNNDARANARTDVNRHVGRCVLQIRDAAALPLGPRRAATLGNARGTADAARAALEVLAGYDGESDRGLAKRLLAVVALMDMIDALEGSSRR